MSDPLLGDFTFGQAAEVIKESAHRSGRRNKHELTLVTIQIEKKEGGYLGRIMAGRGGLFNKSKKEFSSQSLDELLARLSHAARIGYGIIPPGTPFTPTYPRMGQPIQQYAPAPTIPTIVPVVPGVTGSKQCTKCGAYSPEQAKFCLNCSAKFETPPPPQPPANSAAKFCFECGAKVAGSGKFCISCGAKLA
jgi:ribosomal protein L40E